MKKNQLFQFSLTVICSMVLAACGSSGGSSNPTTQATNTTPAANTPTTTPATTPAANPTSEIANGANEVADKDATPLVAYEVDSRKFVGYKHVNKQTSDLNINTSYSNGTADTPVGMNVEDPNTSFDTIVVAEPKNQVAGQKTKVGYLEDFDFRRNNTGTGNELRSGVANFKTTVNLNESQTQLNPDVNGVYNQDNTFSRKRVGTNNPANVVTGTPDTIYGLDNTKTEYHGTKNASALVYAGNTIGSANTWTGVNTDVVGNSDSVDATNAAAIYNYTDTHFAAGSTVQPSLNNGKYAKAANGEYIVTAVAAENTSRSQLARVGGYRTAALQDRNADKSVAANVVAAGTAYNPTAFTTNNVAEVYGYRTFAEKGQYTGKVTDTKVNNLPLENKRLHNVQYGRVTSSLNGHSNFDEFRKGVNLGSGIDTYVVDYGTFGAAGTEDHYFYRGINGITEKQLADLKTNTDNGILKYWGHAVSYGLNNKHDGEIVSANAPTAIGATSNLKFVSGNHVHAWIDLSRNHVEGSIYNTWFKEGTSATQGTLVPVDLVKFKGTLGANGNIAGESELTYKDSKGVFGASLYGANAEEMGGVVASNDKTEAGKWGAVFGAINTSASEIQNATNRRGGN